MICTKKYLERMIVMNGKAHMLGGLFTGVLTATQITLNPITGVFIVSGSILGSLLPDIDSRKSTINKKIPLVGFIWSKISKISNELNLKVIHDLFTHRGALTHSIWSLIPWVVLFAVFHSGFVLGIAGGVLSHHILDLFSPMHLRYFYPVKRKFGLFKLPRILEIILGWIFVLLSVVLLFI